jgi:hypothetical protein
VFEGRAAVGLREAIMPRDITIITPLEVTAAHWRAAAQAAGAYLTGADSTAVTVAAPRFGTILTAAPARLVAAADDVLRLIPEASGFGDRPVWWTEAWAPWGAGGGTGVAVSRALAASLGGVVQAADGE